MKNPLRSVARLAALGTLTALVTVLPGPAALAGSSSCTASTPLGVKTTISTSVLTHDAPTMYVGDAPRTVNVTTQSSISHNETDQAYSILGARSVIGSSDIKIAAGAAVNTVHIDTDPAPVVNGVDVALTGYGSFPFTPPAAPQVVQLKTTVGSTYQAITTFYKGANGTGDVALALDATCTPQAEDNFGAITVKSRSTSTLGTISGPVTAGSTRQVAVNVTVAGGTVAGKARLIIDGVDRPLKTLGGGATSLTLDGLTQGPHTVRAQFVPDDVTLYDGSLTPVQTLNVLPPAVNTTTTLTLNKSSIGSSESLIATGKVTAASGSPVGSVEFVVDGTVHSTKAYAAGDTQVQTTISGLATGIRDIQARFVPTSALSFNPSESSTASVVVRTPSTPTTTVVTLPKNPATSADLISPTATVTAPSGMPTGTVQFFVDAAPMGLPTAVGADGKATRTLGRITTAGAYAVTAEFTPSNVAQFEPSVSAPVSLTITAPGTPTSTTLTLSRTSGTSADPFVATIGVTAGAGSPDGTVKVSVDGVNVATAPLSGGSASVDLPAMDAGDRMVRATYVPADGNLFQASTSANQTVTVTAVTSTTSLNLTPSTASAGANISAVATVTTSAGSPVGVVEFLVDDVVVAQRSVGSGTATVTLPPMDQGIYGVTAKFVPTKPNQQTTSTSSSIALTLTQPVEALVTATTAELAEGTVTVNDNASVSVDVTASGATPTGSVTVSVNGQNVSVDLSGGQAVFSLPTLPIGDYDVVATFLPANPQVFAASQSATLDLHVVGAAVATYTSLEVSPMIAVDGEDVEAIASVSAARGSAVGSVSFSVDGGPDQPVVLDDRIATLVLFDLAPGEHTVTAKFVPADRLDHSASTATARTVTVLESASTATATGLSLSPSTIDAGDSSIVAVTVAAIDGVPTGTVEVTVGGEMLSGSLVDGQVQFSTPNYLAVGTHAVTAVYLPTAASGFAASESTTRTLTIDEAPQGGAITTTALTLSPSRPTLGDEVIASASVSWVGGEPAGQVRFSIDGNQVGALVPLVDGVARLTLPALPVKAYLVSASFEPTEPEETSGSSSDVPLRVVAPDAVATMTALELAPDEIDVDGSSVATATVTRTGGTATGTVVFAVDGSETEVAVTGGTASLDLEGLSAGAHEVLATFEPDTSATLGSESRSRTLTVRAAEPAAIGTSTGLELATETALSTELVSATVRVAANTGADKPVGRASVTVGAVTYVAPLAGGSATISLPPLEVGNHEIKAGFVPATGRFLASTAPPKTIVITAPVAPAPQGTPATVTSTTTRLAMAPTAALGGDMALTATVTGGSSAGVVRFSTGGSLTTVRVVNGVATGSLKALAMGQSSLTATFIPDSETLAPSWSVGTVAVGRAITQARSTATYKKKKGAIDLTTTLSTIGGIARATGKVKLLVKADGKKVVGTSAPIPANGVIKRNFNRLKPAKTYTIVVTYKGSSTTAPVTVTTTVKGRRKK